VALAAAEKERDAVGAALDSALRTTDYGKDKLITVMQLRYGREARQWQANHDQRKGERDVARADIARLTKENDALSKVYGVAASLRTFPVPFDDHLELVDAVDACRQTLHDITFQTLRDSAFHEKIAGREEKGARETACPHCQAGEPSIWDDVLFHYAHPDGSKLKMCHSPWRDRCRRCSANVAYPGARFCGAACSQLREMEAPR
jgi:hypothetical protein